MWLESTKETYQEKWFVFCLFYFFAHSGDNLPNSFWISNIYNPHLYFNDFK